MKLCAALLLVTAAFAQTWTLQNSGTTASLRGISAVNATVAWASGAAGTWLRTTDGGATWHAGVVPDASDLDFRGIKAIDENNAFLMSSGSGDKSRIYRTTDGGATWSLMFTNPDAKGFFDGMAFWDAKHGIVAGDPVDGEIAIFTTDDGGARWSPRFTPHALPNEGGFAASNSSLVVRGSGDVWFGTGGTGAARVFHSTDRGAKWTIATTPIRNDAPSAGIFSLAFSDARHGIAVGGDYTKDSEARQNIAITADGGRTWSPGESPKGFRSAIVWVESRKVWIATGTSGSDISTDGKTWRNFDTGAFHALGTAGDVVWAVGPNGRIATMKLPDVRTKPPAQ